MKRIFGIIGGICVASVMGVSARAGESGPYVKAEVGPTLVENATLREFVGVSSGNKVEFDPGFRFAFGGGYSFNDIVAIGGETGVSFNYFDRISGNFFNEEDSGVGNVPLLANIVLKLPNRTGLVPFIGAGAGVSFAFFSADELVYDPSAAPDDHTIVDGGESDTVFAWQAFGGLKYAINDRMSLGVTYKYLQTEAPKWEVDEDFFSGLSSDIRMSHLKTHTVAFIFSFKF